MIPPTSSSSDRAAAANALAAQGLLQSNAPGQTDGDGDNDGDNLALGTGEQLRSALAAQPEVRPDVVARGMALAADPNYPPSSVIDSIAGRILDSPDLSDDES